MSDTEIELRPADLSLPGTQPTPVPAYGLRAIARQLASLKRYDVNARYGRISNKLTLNVPRALLDGLDAELACPYDGESPPIAWLWRDGYHVEHVWRGRPPQHISAEPVYAAPAGERRRALEECLALCDASLNAAWSQPAAGIRDRIAALLERAP